MLKKMISAALAVLLCATSLLNATGCTATNAGKSAQDSKTTQTSANDGKRRP